MRACSLGLQQTCSELGQRECPAVLRTPARSVVPFEDLTEGDYILRVNCADSEQSCSAGNELHFSLIKLLEGGNSNEVQHDEVLKNHQSIRIWLLIFCVWSSYCPVLVQILKNILSMSRNRNKQRMVGSCNTYSWSQ